MAQVKRKKNKMNNKHMITKRLYDRIIIDFKKCKLHCKYFSFLITARCTTSIFDDLVSLFNTISTFVSYLMPKRSLSKNSSDTILPIAGGIKGFILSPMVLV